MMATVKAWLWQQLARCLCVPAVAEWLIRRAMRTPYRHLLDPDGSIYMERYWLFNAYPVTLRSHTPSAKSYWPRFPSIRLHRIMREDRDRNLHDHPWEARTLLLKGWYIEERLVQGMGVAQDFCNRKELTIRKHRLAGDTAQINLNMFHKITQVSDGGVWTLFITWQKHATWGFMVDGQKVDYRTYLKLDKEQES